MKLGHLVLRLDRFSSSIVALADVCNGRAKPGFDITVSRLQGKGIIETAEPLQPRCYFTPSRPAL